MAVTRTMAVGIATLALVACTKSVSVTPQMARTSSSISAAEAVGAPSHPNAALHLKMARDQLKAAQVLIAEGEKEQAIMQLVRAEKDAQLALTLTRSDEANQQANQDLQKVRALHSELK
jgi:hypothetical protein